MVVLEASRPKTVPSLQLKTALSPLKSSITPSLTMGNRYLGIVMDQRNDRRLMLYVQPLLLMTMLFQYCSIG